MWCGLRSGKGLSLSSTICWAQCSTSWIATAPDPSRSTALPSRQSRTAWVARPPLSESKLTSSARDEVIWTKFSLSAPSRVDSASRPRVLTLDGLAQASASAPPLRKNLAVTAPLAIDRVTAGLRARLPETPSEWQASNNTTTLSATSLMRRVRWAISSLVMVL